MKLLAYNLNKGFDILFQNDDEDTLSVTVSKNNKTGTASMDTSNISCTDKDLIGLINEAKNDWKK